MYYRNGPFFDADRYLGEVNQEPGKASFQDSYWIAALPILAFLMLLGASALLHLF